MGDLPGHPFRGNQYTTAGGEVGIHTGKTIARGREVLHEIEMKTGENRGKPVYVTSGELKFWTKSPELSRGTSVSRGDYRARGGAMSPNAIIKRINEGRADEVDLSVARSHARSGHRDMEGALKRMDERAETWKRRH